MSIRTITAGVIGLLITSSVLAQSDITLKSTEVAPGLYMLEGQGGFLRR